MWFLTHTWIMPALMALSFLAILAVGKRLPKKGSEIGVAAVGICFVLALLTAGSWWQHTNDTGESGEHASGVLAVAPGAGDAEEHDPEAFSDVEQGCSRVVDDADHEGNSEKAEADHEGDTEGEEHSSGIAPGESASAESTPPRKRVRVTPPRSPWCAASPGSTTVPRTPARSPSERWSTARACSCSSSWA